MNGLFDSVIDQLENDIRVASREAFRCYAIKVKKQSAIPVDTGLLRAGLQLLKQTYLLGLSKALFESTARSKQGFDYPTHLDLGGRHQGWFKKVTDEGLLKQCVNETFPRFNL